MSLVTDSNAAILAARARETRQATERARMESETTLRLHRVQPAPDALASALARVERASDELDEALADLRTGRGTFDADTLRLIVRRHSEALIRALALVDAIETSLAAPVRTTVHATITARPWKQFGHLHTPAPTPDHHADVTPGVSIRLYGLDHNRHGGPAPYDRTFRVGDTGTYGSYNLTYMGTILAITDKTITIREDRGEKLHRLDLATFDSRHYSFDVAAACRRNSEWSD